MIVRRADVSCRRTDRGCPRNMTLRQAGDEKKEATMKRLIGIMAAIGAGTLLALSAGPVSAQTAGDPLVMQARQIMDRYAERGTWSSPLLAATSGRAGAQSADTVMAAVLAGYTRALLDRGGWLNPYVNTRNYDAGHPLLAMAISDGATTSR